MTLARALVRAGHRLVGAYNRGSVRAIRFERRFGVRVARDDLGTEIGQADLVLVCVNDDALPAVGTLLRRGPALRRGASVCHTSGALPAATLGEIPRARVGSLHPLVAVPAHGVDSLAGVSFAVEGDRVTRQALAALVLSLHGTSFVVRTADKTRYHAACVMASSLVVALIATASAQARRAHVPAAAARMLELTEHALTAARRRGLKQGLTGPLVRGDAMTVASHLAALDHDSRRLYAMLSLRALTLAKGGRAGGEVKALRDLLVRAAR